MPLFAKRGDLYIVALQCGSGQDAYIEFELTESDDIEPELYEKQPIKYSLSDGVDPEEIKSAALLGVERVNEKLNTHYKLKKIGYIPNDSTHYDLHERIVVLVLSRIHDGGEFRDFSSKV